MHLNSTDPICDHLRTSVYILAHQDDSQLFMNPQLYKDIRDQYCKTIVIHVTAGDAGNDKPFWLSKEKAAIQSILFPQSLTKDAQRRYIRFKNKLVHMVKCANQRFYFLRLPDGGRDGAGFGRFGYQSLEKLRLARINTLVTVDNASVYFDFMEIAAIIDLIVAHEQPGHAAQPAPMAKTSNVIRFTDFDNEWNPDDHSDHYNAGHIARGTKIYETYEKYAYKGYDIMRQTDELEGEELFLKTGMFSIYHSTLLDQCGYSVIEEKSECYKWCLKRSQFRKI